MGILGENSTVRLGLAVSAAVAVAMVSYQQGQIQAATPKEGQYVTSLVFAATMAGVDTRLSAISDAQDLRFKLMEQELVRVREELARMRQDVSRALGSQDAQTDR